MVFEETLSISILTGESGEILPLKAHPARSNTPLANKRTKHLSKMQVCNLHAFGAHVYSYCQLWKSSLCSWSPEQNKTVRSEVLESRLC